MMRIFVSYTTRSNEISKDVLSEIRIKISIFASVYIDLLEDCIEKSQEQVLYELSHSNVVLLLDTDEIEQSEWVEIEIEHAKKNKIPIIRAKPSEMLNMSNQGIRKLFEGYY